MLPLLFLNLNAIPGVLEPVVTAFDYSRLELIAAKLIKRFGRLATLRRISKVPGTPTKRWESATGTAIDSDVTLVFLDYNIKDVDGTNILRGDQRVFLRGNVGVNISDQDFVIDGTLHWSVKNVQPLNPGGTNLLYELQLRQ